MYISKNMLHMRHVYKARLCEMTFKRIIFQICMKIACRVTSVDNGWGWSNYLIVIQITDSAKVELQRLQSTQAEAGQFLRIFVEPGGCSGFEYGMSFDAGKEGDEKLEDNGITFHMDATSLDYLRGSVVDFDDGLGGKGFEIRNPNATSTCGCGRSFN